MVIKEYEENLPAVRIDKEQIQEVFINIINNAIEAMSNSGQIKIKIINRDKFVEIILSDTGPGIPKENLKNIFTPFFHTNTCS